MRLLVGVVHFLLPRVRRLPWPRPFAERLVDMLEWVFAQFKVLRCGDQPDILESLRFEHGFESRLASKGVRPRFISSQPANSTCQVKDPAFEAVL